MSAIRNHAGQRGGILIKCMVLLAAFLACGALAWMLVLPYAMTAWMQNRTGFDVTVDALMINPISGRLTARGLVVSNPPTFPQSEFLRIREFSAAAEVWSLFTAEPKFNTVKLDIELVALVKRADGRSNAEVFRVYLAESAGRPAPITTTRGKGFLIQNLELRFDRLLLADYTGPRKQVREYPLKLDRTFNNVRDAKQLMLPASLDQIFDLGGAVGSLLPEEIGRMLDKAMHSGGALFEHVTQPNKAFNRFSDTLEESKKP
ncbi:MAG: hypothetical protein K9M98_00465 [Cephaloticoccus sp.]|nr:hypothetical protein [Cephaloticoccus sp.]MCF7758950.1 hypothetical protein [Cephaloticoccus sp.]